MQNVTDTAEVAFVPIHPDTNTTFCNPSDAEALPAAPPTRTPAEVQLIADSKEIFG